MKGAAGDKNREIGATRLARPAAVFDYEPVGQVLLVAIFQYSVCSIQYSVYMHAIRVCMIAACVVRMR